MSSFKFRHWLFLIGLALLIVGFFGLYTFGWTGVIVTALGGISMAVSSLLVPEDCQ